jgi:hypothetical protein
MIRQLVLPGNPVPAVSSTNNFFPTTGNVHIYTSEMGFLKDETGNVPAEVSLIDLEGSNSPMLPKYVMNSVR